MKKAFTLIELMIVVIIIGILATLALPRFQAARYKAILTEVVPAIRSLEGEIELYLQEHDWPPTGIYVLDPDSQFYPNFLGDYELPEDSDYFYYMITFQQYTEGGGLYQICAATKDSGKWVCIRQVSTDGSEYWFPGPAYPWSRYLDLP